MNQVIAGDIEGYSLVHIAFADGKDCVALVEDTVYAALMRFGEKIV